MITAAAATPPTATIARGRRVHRSQHLYHSGGKRERRQGGAVDQPEHDEGEAERANTGRTRWIAADDGDPHCVVEAAGKHQSDQCSTAVCLPRARAFWAARPT